MSGPRKPKMSQARLEYWIAEERKWIKQCGESLTGYILNYGSAKDPHHYGDGGEAIYKADTDALARLIAQRTPKPKKEQS